ncbi:metabotropic glutamate receptor 4-like isoform X2 [Rhopilema esculentum]
MEAKTKIVILVMMSVFLNLETEAATLPSMPGLCYITGYFAVHSPLYRDGRRYCGTINIQDGVLLLEAFRYAINVTNNIGLLPKSFTIGYQVFDTCKSTSELKKHFIPTILANNKILGVVGPYTSSASVLAANVFSLFHTTEISYRASSLELEDRGRYQNFYRTVPSDRYEAEAIVDILLKHKWTYVSCVSSHEKQLGLLVLKSLIEKKGCCIANQVLLPEIPEVSSYDDAIDSVTSNAKVKVIILFTTREDTLQLLLSAKKRGYTNREIVWIGGTGWGNLMLPSNLGPLGHGSISLHYKSHKYDEEFIDYFKSLNPSKNTYLAFREFWEAVFECTYSTSDRTKPPCTGREKLTEGKGLPQLASLGPVMDAVFIYAQALKIGLEKTCGENITPKCFSTHFDGNIVNWISTSLANEKFKSLHESSNISFDAVGGVEGKFEVLNLLWKGDRYEYQKIGTWESSGNVRLVVVRNMTWPNGESGIFISRCSEPCKRDRGEVQLSTLSLKGISCCWNCKLCKPNEIISTNESCQPCSEGFKPNTARERCDKLAEDHISFTHPVGKIAIALSVVGILLTTFVLVLFVCRSKCPVVKASSRELSYVMLLSLYICFTAAVIFLTPPSKIICSIQRFIAGLSLNLCYASLLLKTNRLYRIFKNATLSVTKPSLTSPTSQLAIVLGIASIQVLLGVVWSIGDPPKVSRHYPDDKDYVMIYCNTDATILNVNLCVCLILMLACTFFAFKTRNFPKNFNESKSTMLTMYASCFVWGVFLPIFILSDNKSNYTRTYTIVLFCDIIAYVTLTGLFAPKVRMILCPRSVVDESSGGVPSRAEIRTLKKNTFMSRAIISSYPAVTSQYIDAVEESSPDHENDGQHQSTSTTDLHL